MDRFGDTARKGLDFLKSRAKETVEVGKLNSSIRDLEERRNQCLMDLGHRVMAMFDVPGFDKEALRDRVDEVRRLNSELESTRTDYEAVKSHLKSSVEEILPQRPRDESSSAPPSHGSTPPSPSYDATSPAYGSEPVSTPHSEPAAPDLPNVPKPPEYDSPS